MLVGVAVTTLAWLAITFATPPMDEVTLEAFVPRARRGGPGWRRGTARMPADPDSPDGGDLWVAVVAKAAWIEFMITHAPADGGAGSRDVRQERPA